MSLSHSYHQVIILPIASLLHPRGGLRIKAGAKTCSKLQGARLRREGKRFYPNDPLRGSPFYIGGTRKIRCKKS